MILSRIRQGRTVYQKAHDCLVRVVTFCCQVDGLELRMAFLFSAVWQEAIVRVSPEIRINGVAPFFRSELNCDDPISFQALFKKSGQSPFQRKFRKLVEQHFTHILVSRLSGRLTFLQPDAPCDACFLRLRMEYVNPKSQCFSLDHILI
ncbi:hypothetical protein PSE_2737 [Pseudovibrio sp. FO-BEG1]|nr:hypothetical protein PSE_2737 [Pseudovibrio sp. FO-BEG1]